MSLIFILGITGRSGTNYLYNLLLTHPDCEGSSLMAEDFIIYGLDQLDKYTNKVASKWKKEWNYNPKMQSKLKKSLGKGIEGFLKNTSTSKCIVSKTPSTLNIDRFFDFFQEAKLIIIIRDGKNVVESGVKSNFWNYEMGFHIWDKSAKRILNFLKNNKPFSDRILLVKYENLINSLSEEMARVLDYCELDFDKYNMNKAKHTKILGSSTVKTKEKEFVWKVIPEKSNFNPLNRSLHWNKTLHYRYNRKCGDSTQKFGYSTKHPKKGITYYLINLIWDVKYFYIIIKNKIKPI